MRYRACLALLVSTSACVLPLENGSTIDSAREVSPTNPPPESEVKKLSTSKRWVVLSRRSSLVVSGHDSVLGDHTLTFDRWMGRIEGEPARLTVDIDLSSLRSNESLVESITRDHLIEVHKHRHATLVASLGAIEDSKLLVIDGTANIHGSEGPIKFTGNIQLEEGAVKFDASFPMSRRAFGLLYPPVEPFLDDTFKVTVHAVAKPERVDAEELD
jgi:polyisoprenoid-binding protein YceI